jgi:hypothetical protein
MQILLARFLILGCFDLNFIFRISFQPYFREYQLSLQLHSLIYPIHYLISQI